MKAILSKHVLFLFLLAAAFLTFSAGVCYHAVRVLSDHHRWVTRTYEVLGHLEAAKGLMWLAERDERNYVITGQEKWLAGYAEASRNLDQELNVIERMTEEDPAQQKRMAVLREVVASRMRSLDDAIVAYQKGGIDAARERIVDGGGPRLMEQAVGLIDAVEREERVLLAARTQRSATSLQSLVLTFTLVALMSTGLLGLIFLSVRREARIRAEAERRVRESEARLLVSVEAAEMGIWERNLVTGVGTCNERFGQIFGLPKEERSPSRKQIMNSIHPEDRDRVERAYERLLEPGPRSEKWLEYRVVWPDGTVRWVRAQARVVFEGTGRARRPVRLVGTAIDVTEQKRTEEDLRRAMEDAERAATAAVEASRAKDQFLAVLSHELRTPLTPVLAATWEMERRADLPEGLRAELATVRRNIELEARLIDDLLDLTRISRGKVRLHPEVVDLHALIGGVMEMFAGAAAEKRLRMAAELSAVRHHVWGDPGRLQQVLWNLVSNSVKFTPPGGVVIVRTRDEDETRVALEVADTGIGISKEALPRLFNAFEQAEQSISRKYGGLGLGLSIAKAIADLHGGELEARSSGTGQGAVFRLTLKTVEGPTREGTAKQVAAGEEEPAKVDGRGRLRILLVEDNEDTRRLMGRLLRTFGHHVEAADGVASALEVAKRERFDLLVSDIGLPDGTGWELMEKLGDRRPGKAIALSGFGMEEDLRRSREAGFVEHMTKPVNIAALREMIERVGGGGRGDET